MATTPQQPPRGASGPEIAFFDVESTTPTPERPRRSLLEFGVVLVCPRTLVGLGAFSTLVRPLDLASVPLSQLCKGNGITPEAIAAAPLFSEVANIVYGFLHGRVWAGHNVAAFDSARIEEAFAEVGQPAPRPRAVIDSLLLLHRVFRGRTPNMKMSTLATHFGLGRQMHRSLDDVHMNIEILKRCGMLLLLEAAESRAGPSSSTSNGAAFLEMSDVRLDAIDATLAPGGPAGGACRIQLLYGDAPLQLLCPGLLVRYGPNRRFCDAAGRPKLTFVVDADRSLCELLATCDDVAWTMSVDSGSTSEWQPVVQYNSSFSSYDVRLRIPARGGTDDIAYATEIHRRINPSSGDTCMLVFDRLDEVEQDELFAPGTLLDAYIRLGTYDFMQKAGITLVAEKLVIHCTTHG